MQRENAFEVFGNTTGQNTKSCRLVVILHTTIGLPWVVPITKIVYQSTTRT